MNANYALCMDSVRDILTMFEKYLNYSYSHIDRMSIRLFHTECLEFYLILNAIPTEMGVLICFLIFVSITIFERSVFSRCRRLNLLSGIDEISCVHRNESKVEFLSLNHLKFNLFSFPFQNELNTAMAHNHFGGRN